MTRIKKRFSAIIIIPATVFIFLSILSQPRECSQVVRETLKSLYENVIPVLFPFTVVSGIITGLRLTRPFEKTVGKAFPVLYRLPPSSGIAFVLGALCSYPVGALTAADLYRKGAFSKKEAEIAAALVSVTGPSFPVAVVGTLLLGNSRAGWLIYAVQLAVPLILGIPFCRSLIKKGGATPALEEKPGGERALSVLTESIASSSTRCLTVCGSVLLFSLFCDRLIALTGISGTAKAVIYSFFEFSEGCRHSASANGGATAICAFAVSYGGLSVVVQSAFVMEKEGLSVSKLAFFKLICGVVCATVVFILTSLFERLRPGVSTAPAFSSTGVSGLLSAASLFILLSGAALRIIHLILRRR